MVHKQRDVESALQAKGFRVRDRRHRFFVYYSKVGRPTPVQTMVSHGSQRDIGPDLSARMARQCGLTRREFDELVRCPLSRDEYERKLVDAGVI